MILRKIRDGKDFRYCLQDSGTHNREIITSGKSTSIVVDRSNNEGVRSGNMARTGRQEVRFENTVA